MKSKKFLIIGSNSFSGSHFVRRVLSAGHQAWGVSRSPEPDTVFLPYRWREKDNGLPIANKDNFAFKRIDLNHHLPELIKLIDLIKPEFIVNFCAQGMVAESWLNPIHWYKTNVLAQVESCTTLFA